MELQSYFRLLGEQGVFPLCYTVEYTVLYSTILQEYAVATLIMRLQAESCHFLLQMLFGSSQKLPAIWHGAGAYPGVLIPETYKNVIIRPSCNLFLSVAS